MFKLEVASYKVFVFEKKHSQYLPTSQPCLRPYYEQAHNSL